MKQNHFNEKEKIKSHVLAGRPSCWQVGLGTLTSICHVHGTHYTYYTYCSASTELVTIFYVVAFRPSLPHGRQREGLRKAMAGLHGGAGTGGAAGDGRAGGARGSWSVAAKPPLWEVSQSFRRLGAWPILLPAPPEVEPSVVSPAMSRLRPRTSGRAPRAVSRRGGGVRTPREVGEAAATAVVTGGCPAASRRATSGWGDAH